MCKLYSTKTFSSSSEPESSLTLELSALVEEVSDELTSSLFSSKSAAVARDELGRTSSGAVSVKFGESSMAAFFDGPPGL